MTNAAKRTVSFTYNVHHAASAATRAAIALLEDVTYEVGHHDRMAYRGTLSQWDVVHAAMTADRDAATGSEKGTLTSALGRIWTTAIVQAEQDARAMRLAARRAAAAK